MRTWLASVEDDGGWRELQRARRPPRVQCFAQLVSRVRVPVTECHASMSRPLEFNLKLGAQRSSREQSKWQGT